MACFKCGRYFELYEVTFLFQNDSTAEFGIGL